ncbi:hypothetical protein Taro_046955 [Colocasia esculenta]|uniref:Uncharacterized protein n=1 Tax=Colocasia esculenta TaxID=4460 RepID=A0A843WZW7_COLES|nr:hypothetical protein [Colocasia esculenta]
MSHNLKLMRHEFNKVWKLHDETDTAESNQATSSAAVPPMPHGVDHVPIVLEAQFEKLQDFLNTRFNAMASRGRRNTQAQEDEQRREGRGEQQAPTPQGPTVQALAPIP